MSQKISPEITRHVATLARIELSEEEISRLSSELSKIVSYAEKLNQLDTSNIEATSHVLSLVNALRKDVVKNSFTAEEAVFSAPDVKENLFAVPPIKESETSV